MMWININNNNNNNKMDCMGAKLSIDIKWLLNLSSPNPVGHCMLWINKMDKFVTW